MQVALLRALSRIMAELPHIPEITLQQCVDIADRIAQAYPSLWPKQQLPVHAAFCDLLAALAPKQALLNGLLPRLVACMLTHTLRPPETTTPQPGANQSGLYESASLYSSVHRPFPSSSVPYNP